MVANLRAVFFIRALAQAGTFHLTGLVEDCGRDQPFAIRLAFLDLFVRREDFFCDFYLQQCLAARTFTIVEWPI